MNIEKENIDDLNAVVKITIQKDDYAERVAEVLKSYQKKANMPGFRPGKVPLSLIKKMYGNAVLIDEINKLVSQSLSEYISENELNILGEPLSNENQKTIDFDQEEEFEFIFDLGLSPKIEVKLTKRDKVPYYIIALSEEVIDNQIETLTGRFGKNEQVENIGEKSLVKGDFVQVDSKGDVVEGGISAEDSLMSVAVIKDQKEKKKLIGKAVGDTVVFNIKKAFPNENELSYLLKVTKEQAAEVNGTYALTIKEISDHVAPELNQELYDMLFEPGSVTSVEEMRKKVEEDLEKSFLMESDYRFSIDARKKLNNKIKVELPEEFLKRWMKAGSRDNEDITDEQIEKDMPQFLEDLKWQLIKNEIIRSNDLKVEEDDVLSFAIKSAHLQFMQYGMINLPEEHLENYARDMMKDPEQGRRYVEGALSEKVMAYIKENINADSKEISRDEFNKLFDNN